MKRKWQRALADLDRIVTACRGRKMPLFVVLIPDEFQVNEAVLQNAMRVGGFTLEQLDLTGPQRRLQAFFSSRDIPCLDLLPALRAAENTYAEFDTHWNVTGNHLAAREVGAWLRKASR
jgi:hypothetical protein